MSLVIKKVLFIFICSCLILPRLVFSQNDNEAIEPTVNGPGTIDLLEGGTLDAWKVPSPRWFVDEESIVAQTGTEKLELPEWLYTKQKFSDFEFTCELRLTGDNHRNTGIYFRVNTFMFQGPEFKKSFEAPSGYEFDASYHNPSEKDFWGSLGDWYTRKSLRIYADQSIISQVCKPEKWNRMTIRARGNRLEYWINSIKVMDFVDNDPTGSREGVFGLQIHNGSIMKVEYRNIRVLSHRQ